jgi:hypothetical protein
MLKQIEIYLKNIVTIAMMKQETLIHGLSLSPITAKRPNNPTKPGFFASMNDGKRGRRYVAVQMDSRTTVISDWKLKRAVIEEPKKFRHALWNYHVQKCVRSDPKSRSLISCSTWFTNAM